MRESNISDIFWIIIAILSVAVNFHLITVLLDKPNETPKNARCRIRNATPDRQPVIHSPPELDGLPRFTGALSHVILEINDASDETSREAELARIKKLFAYWQKYPPCLLASYPTSWTFTQITLTMLLRRKPSEAFSQSLRESFNSLPLTVRACFRSFEIRHADIAPSAEDSAKIGLEREREEGRELFASLMSNKIGLEAANHAIYIAPDCVPIQPNWINLLDYRTRPPNEPFWMLGSIFRGQRGQWVKNLASFINIGRYAIYNLASPEFRNWYLKAVKKYTEEIPVPQYDFGRWEMDIFHYIADLAVSTDFQFTSPKFRYTNTVLNQWNMTINVAAILEKEPDVALVCGIVPDMTQDLPQ